MESEPRAMETTMRDGDTLEEGVDVRRGERTSDEDTRELSTYGTPLGRLGRVDGLERFINLRSLRAHACELTTMECEAFNSLKSLEELDLSSNAISSVRGLVSLPRLRLLNLASNALESLEGLAEASTTLERVNVSNNQLKSLSGLARSDGREWGIRMFDARGNALRSFQAVRTLSELTKLESLRLKTERDGLLGPETNDICEVPAYRLTMASLIPWLSHLDDVVVSVDTATKAMSKTLESNGGTPVNGSRGSMTPPPAEQFVKTPRRDDPRREGSALKTRGIQVNLASARRSIDFTDKVKRVRNEGQQTDKPSTKDAQTQKTSNEVVENEQQREESVILREELTQTKEMLESLTTREAEAREQVDYLESTLRAVRLESAENLANLKAMYVDEQNAMLNECVDQARKESAACVEVSEENARLKERAGALENEIRALTEAAKADQAKIKSTEDTLQQTREALRGAQDERLELEALNEELAVVVESQRDEIAGYAGTTEVVRLLETELERARSANQQRETTHKTINNARNAALKAEKAAIAREERARDREQLADRLIQDVEALQSKLEAADEGMRIKSDMLQHQNELIKSLKAEVVRMRQQNAEEDQTHKARIIESETVLRATTEECRALASQVESLELEMTELETALAESDVDHASYEHAIKNARVAVAERDQIIAQMTSQLAQVSKTLENRDSIDKARNTELEMQVIELREQLAIARQKAKFSEDRLIAFQEESDIMVREAYKRVEEVEGEMRALLCDMASEKRANRERMEQIGRLLNADVPLELD
ncbi:myosin class II heavy chain [Ostreococcus tauri]|uniref:Myosin class II heavy chain n=1 Tax=Ostreococcus tauri TaxID=70448 RepID=A0A1Y5I8A4_OSTTA|nr:myosin class II heavy chain [Ostreococcus tauri]